MSANLLSIQLRANELEDDSQQRTGALHGQTVIVDMRDGRPALISDGSWQSALQACRKISISEPRLVGRPTLVPRAISSSAAERQLTFRWPVELCRWRGADLRAGGQQCQSYNIATAKSVADLHRRTQPHLHTTYNGLVFRSPSLRRDWAPTSPATRRISAGTVSFSAPAMAMQGTLLGSAVHGPYQRSAATIPAESFAALPPTMHIPSNGAAAIARAAR